MLQEGTSFVLTNRHFQDFNPVIIGWENCKPDKEEVCDVSRYALIHYVHKGRGFLLKDGERITVHSGEAFLRKPYEKITYVQDPEDPWHYSWVGFGGAYSEKLEEWDTVFKYETNYLEKMLECAKEAMCEYTVASLLFQMYAELLSPQKEQSNYVTRVKDYVNALYMRDISVEGIAAHVSLDRRYMTRLFKLKTGKTVQEYIISVRLAQAKEYIKKGTPIEEAALLVGYADRTNFSKAFKQKFGISPAEWRKASQF